MKEGYGRWLVAGTALLGILLVGLWFVHVETDPAQQLAIKASRIDLIERMQFAVATSGEAEKSAVLAINSRRGLPGIRRPGPCRFRGSAPGAPRA